MQWVGTKHRIAMLTKMHVTTWCYQTSVSWLNQTCCCWLSWLHDLWNLKPLYTCFIFKGSSQTEFLYLCCIIPICKYMYFFSGMCNVVVFIKVRPFKYLILNSTWWYHEMEMLWNVSKKYLNLSSTELHLSHKPIQCIQADTCSKTVQQISVWVKFNQVRLQYQT